MIKSLLKKSKICCGVYLKWKKIKIIKSFQAEFVLFNQKSEESKTQLAKKEDQYPCLDDKTSTTGFDAHYLYHPAWAARVLAQTKPQKHIDISSILNFSAYVSAFIPIDYYEYRPVNLNLENLRTAHADILHLPFADESVESLSCMHVIEHIGLGRYGDELDPLGDLKAFEELKRIVQGGGTLLLVVPVGKDKIMFNAHRIYSYQRIISIFKEWRLKEFALIPDNAYEVGLIRNATETLSDEQNYGCGCFWFEKEGK